MSPASYRCVPPVCCVSPGWLLLSCPLHLVLEYEPGHAYDKVPNDLTTLSSNIYILFLSPLSPFIYKYIILFFLFSMEPTAGVESRRL